MPTSVQIAMAIVDAERGVRQCLSVSSLRECQIDGLQFAVDASERPLLRATGATTVERLGRVWQLQAGGAVVVLDGDVIVTARGRRCIRVLGTWRVSRRSSPRNEVRTRPLGAAWLAAFLGLVTPALAVAADVPATVEVSPSRASRSKAARTPEAPTTRPGFGRVSGQIQLEPGNVKSHEFSVSLIGADHPTQRTVPDESGHFAFDNVPAGTYELQLLRPARTYVEGTLTIGDEARPLVDSVATLEVRAGTTTEAVLLLQAHGEKIGIDQLTGVVMPDPPTPLVWPNRIVQRPLVPWAGMIEVRSGIAVDLGAGHVAKPLSVPLSLGYGLTDRTTLVLFSDGGLCVHGDGRCNHVVNDAGADLIRVFMADRQGLQLAARAGVGFVGFSPNVAVARAGFMARLAGEEWALQFDPLVQITANQREQSPDLVRLPVTVQIQLDHATAFARGAWEVRRGSESTSVVPVAAGLALGSRTFDLGLQLAFPRVAGSGATLDERNLMLFFAYRWARDEFERTRYWDEDRDQDRDEDAGQ